ncbi:asparagine synthase (glutamine-hydrolyzing) [Horticoccus sp. 23ND18S-11]|uniref:asparagine synthase (glutamine-hydrolyzing) n=1 Tax=Horticoccus sp. 23ND18S-11 TaxID=3391832 RepID=UPI0039C9A7D5
MCGIVGWVEPRGLTLAVEHLNRARDTLQHRGPDDARSAHDAVCYLGFRRLAILDLSAAGAQPLRSADDSHWIVFNGEIYNFLELRAELEREGVVFRGHSDTEVLLALYRRHGHAMLERLNGMFAFAIYDRSRRTLWLARDRLGEKPLYLWPRAHGFAFASELRALRMLPDFPAETDPAVVADYFRFGFVPGTRCIWPGVRKLPPACSIEYNLATGQLGAPVRYWTPPAVAPVHDESSVEETVERVGALIDGAVALRLRADVPVGCFLSGGLDSSLVAESAARQSGRTMSALTVSFPGWGDDESAVASETAERFGFRTHVIPLDAGGLDEVPALCAHFDEPFADASLLPTALVCRAARRHFTVVLGGDGGDEAFGGYDNHVRAARFGWVDRVPRVFRQLAGGLSAWAPADSRLERLGRRLPQPTGRWGLGAKLYPFERTGSRLLAVSGEDAATACARIDADLGVLQRGALDEAQRTDLQLYLPDDVLVKTDRMSMRSSLEVRAPFLDHHVVAAGLALPPELRVSEVRGKHVLRLLARRRGFSEAVWNGPKRGFGVPLRPWLWDGPGTARMREVFLGGASRVDAMFHRPALLDLWSRAERNPALTASVFRVLAFRWWHAGLHGGDR